MSCLPEGHAYSYSQLSSVDECPYSFYMERIETEPDGSQKELQSNFFAEHGTLMHRVLELWAKDMIKQEEMPETYKSLYTDYVQTPPPPYMSAYKQKAYDNGLEYFENFDGWPNLNVIGAEETFQIDLELPNGETRPFKGVVDLIARHKMSGNLIILDHKSKSMKEFKKNREAMYRQQYLYSAYVKEKYGAYPDRLMFNLFKENVIDEIPFNIDDYRDTIQWAADRIYEIEDRDIFTWLELKDSPDFFCNEICSVRAYCPNGILKPTPKGKGKK